MREDCGCPNLPGSVTGRYRHMWHCPLITPEDLFVIARVTVMRNLPYTEDTLPDLVGVALEAGVRALQSWRPDTGTRYCATWVSTAMRRGLVDDVRAVLGRTGGKRWVVKASSLDEEIRSDSNGPDLRTRLAFVADEHAQDLLEGVETSATVLAMIRAAHLTSREQDSIDAFLRAEPLKVTGVRWGVSESSACQVRQRAFRKLRAVA